MREYRLRLQSLRRNSRYPFLGTVIRPSSLRAAITFTHLTRARLDMQRVALANAVREFEEGLGLCCHIACLEIQNQLLIVRYYSQSKLSQQELADLQKATHFDKKELQQWYKGAHRVY